MQFQGLELDPFQQQAIESLAAGHSVLVAAPTGTGKTIVADWLIDQALKAGKRVVYTAPIKALSNQKYRDYCRVHGEENVGLLTGDLVIRREAACLVMTTEILRNMLLGDERQDDLYAVVLDEIHFIDDRERGTVWEEVLIYLPTEVPVLGLSATLPNLDELANWMTSVRDRPVTVVREPTRAVPLTLHIASTATGIVTPERFEQHAKKARKQGPDRRRHRGRPKRSGGRQRDQGRRTSHADVFPMMRDAEFLPYLYFAFSRKNCESFATNLMRKLRGESLLDLDQRRDLEARVDKVEGDAVTPELAAMYRAGVAFHHAGLNVRLKALVEELYEARLIQVLYCTSTFALGVNMPARAVVFDGLSKFDGRELTLLTTRQFMQKAGRAGRRGMDQTGHVVLRLDPEDWGPMKGAVRRYRAGEYEPVHSSFNLSWNSVVNLVGRHDMDAVRELVQRSLLAWQYEDLAKKSKQRAREPQREGSANPSRRQRAEIKRLNKNARRAGDRCWEEFTRKLDFLVQVGYLDAELQFNAGATVLQHVQIAEILVTEIVLDGVLEGLDNGTLFGVLCGIVSEFPRGVTRNYPIAGEDRVLARHIETIRNTRIVVDAEDLSGVDMPWSPEHIELGRAWHNGDSLAEVLQRVSSRTDMSGTIVGVWRRARDLANQLKHAYADSFPDRADQLDAIMRAVRRDEVEVVA